MKADAIKWMYKPKTNFMTNQITPTNGQIPAVIVFRHGCDGGSSNPYRFTFPDNIDISYKGKYNNINGQVVTIANDWLGKLGHHQADTLGATGSLPSWFISRFCPVSRVITENPGDGQNGTPNPLNTVRPFIANIADRIPKLPGGKLKLDMYDNVQFDSLKDVFKGSELLKDGNYSTVISWEAMGMWRLSSGDYVSNSILGVLAKDNENLMIKKNSPQKGQTIYVFTELNVSTNRFDNLEVYNFNPDTAQFTLNKDTNWPATLCTKAEQHN